MSWNPIVNWLTRRLEREVLIAENEVDAANKLISEAQGEDDKHMAEFMLMKAKHHLISRKSILNAHLTRTA